ncbi:M23 family metallopeptidase [Gulosibacter macacae]|uniref:M23 family metallopeptidase n=1 Tax=Gulosibacter macacae TaxID=2488791 RepID=A0A3P3W198_9MICO|nr:M23 family metallopeptidase [Gulosibacter macacae]RRJ87469.1 M23 family metallopeptidase [Gulosibacter macacae]
MTRRQAREIERLTGVRPVAVAPTVQPVIAHDFRHDTGEIKRNELNALISVIPAELLERIAEPAVAAAPARIPASFAGRAITVRAAVPAQIVSQRRRRVAGGFAAAASVGAMATVGLASAANAPAPVEHQANLMGAMTTTETTADVAALPETAATEVAAAPAPEAVVEETTVAAFDTEAVLAAAETIAPTIAETLSPESAMTPASTAYSSPMGPGAQITSSYGNRIPPVTGVSSFHRGTDFTVAGGTCGAPLYAVSSGTIAAAGWSGTYGNTIDLDGSGSTTFRYAHLETMLVSPGQFVNSGDIIGYAGTTGASTGCHLHFEVFEGGTNVDPEIWLGNLGLL